VDARIEALVTFDLSEQPDGDTDLSSKDITLQSITIPTAIGAVTLPTLKFSKLNLKGRMNDSRLYIEELELGGPSDPLQLKVKGDSGFYFKQGRGASPVVVENFKIKIQLDVSSEMQSSLYFISLLDEFKKNGTQGNSRYLFRVSGRNLQNPDISDLSSF
ncbi:MAG: hypothetical protein KDD50_02475, partial [Bdellovibrionales bacterium]|nr:hypothetical protein [Bdellovibrionales bacterium]